MLKGKKLNSPSQLPTIEEASKDPINSIEVCKEKIEKSDAAYHKGLNNALAVLFACSTAILKNEDLTTEFVQLINDAELRQEEISLPLEDDELFRLASEYVFMNTQSQNRASKYARVIDLMWLHELSDDEAARAFAEAGVEKLYRVTTTDLPTRGLSKKDKRAAREKYRETHADESEDASELIRRASAYLEVDRDAEEDDDRESNEPQTPTPSAPAPKTVKTNKDVVNSRPSEDDDDTRKMRLPSGARVSVGRETLHVEIKSADLARILTGGSEQFAISVRVSEPNDDSWIFVRAFGVVEIDD